MKHSLAIIFVILVLGNCKNERPGCSENASSEVELRQIKVRFRIPSNCILTDTTIFDNVYNDQVLSHVWKSRDGMVFITANIENDQMYKPFFNFDKFHDSNQHEIASIPGSVNTLLLDSVKNLQSFKLGYLKYAVKINEEHYDEGRIFFLKDNFVMQMTITEKFKNGEKKSRLVMDCLFDSIYFY